MPREELEWALAATAKTSEAYELYRDYYEGRHRLLFATEKFRNTFGDLFQAFADNLCAPVVDAVADRLQLRGFAGAGAEAAWEIWKANRMRRRAGEVHLDAGRLGDSFVAVWPDARGQVRLYPQEPTNMAVRYSEEEPDTPELAAKVWPLPDKRWRATVYFPERLERWVTSNPVPNGRPDKASLFVPVVDDVTPEPTEGVQGNPWGRVPVFHFANNAPAGRLGRSELADVVPLQDALNKAVADMLVAMEFVALPQRYATGVQVTTDPLTGEADPNKAPVVKPGAVWTVADDNAHLGQFDGADLNQFLAVQEAFRVEIARVSGTPMHLLTMTGEVPSGLALRVLEGRLVRKVEDRAATFGDVWADVLRLAMQMSGAAEAADLEASWEPAGTRDELYEVQVQEAKRRLGVSMRTSLRELGYSDEEIDTIEDERQVDDAAMGAAMLASFDRGGAPVTMSQGRALASE